MKPERFQNDQVLNMLFDMARDRVENNYIIPLFEQSLGSDIYVCQDNI